MVDKNQKLEKNLGFFTAISTVMGIVIGAGVFFKTATVVERTESANLTLFAWLISGIITICAGLTTAELATAVPETGGAVKYVEHIYGKLPAFLLGWAQMLVYYPANIGALAIIFSTQLLNLFHWPTKYLVPVAILTALFILITNLIDNKLGGYIQQATLVIKLIPIALIIIFGLLEPATVHFAWLPLKAGGHQNFATALSGGVLATMFAYDGWLSVGNIAGEMKHPEKDLSKAISIGLTAITAIYVLINLAFLKVLPVSQIAGNLDTAAIESQHMFGNIGGKLVTIGICISVYGAMNGYTMTGMRVPYALGADDLLPMSKSFSKLTKHGRMPYVAGIFQFLVTLVMISLGSFDFLTDMLVFVIWLFSTLILIGVPLLRRREPELLRPYKVPLYPLIPLIAILGGFFILIETITTEFNLALTGLILTAIGIPVYLIHKRHKAQKTS